MRSSSLFSFVGAAVAMASATLVVAASGVSRLKLVADWAWRRVAAFVVDVVTTFSKPERGFQPAVAIHQACAYASKLAKRERPRMTPGWRMCPSA